MRNQRESQSLLGTETNAAVSSPIRKRTWLIGGAVVASILVAVIIVVVVVTTTKSDPTPAPPTLPSLADNVKMPAILAHLNSLQLVANTPGYKNSRAVELGYNASAQFIIDKLRESGDCEVSTQLFQVPVTIQNANPALDLVAPFVQNFSYQTDFTFVRYGGNGSYDITASVVMVANSGCLASDYVGVAGNIAMIASGGNCTTYNKALVAKQANPAAILYINAACAPQNAPCPLSYYRIKYDRVWNTTMEESLVFLPQLSITAGLATTLRSLSSSALVRVRSNSTIQLETTMNVFCDTPRGNSADLIIVGAHLDGVQEGPGINDNGSGSATVLEIALQVAKLQLPLTSQIRFAWWGAEELGLMGSRYFVDRVLHGDDDVPRYENIVLNLNFDMVASPNYIIQIHNGNSAPAPVAVKNASTVMQLLFEKTFNSMALPYSYAPMTGGSDYYSFVTAGIPAGGLAAGASAVKTVSQVTRYGGIANIWLDPCYHQYCDGVENINTEALTHFSAGAATVIQQLAQEPNLRALLATPPAQTSLSAMRTPIETIYDVEN